MTDKRIVVISDLHCGHLVGLTPPPWQTTKRKKWAKIQEELYGEYKRMVTENYKPDVLIVNADCIDGRGEKSGGTELIVTDRLEQCEMATYAINEWAAEHIVMTYGTPYHTGTHEDFERVIADRVGADKLGSHEWIEVNGVIFDIKHKTGSSTIPHGKGTPISKERLWNVIWAEHDEQPKSDVLIRSHVHYYYFTGERHWLGLTTPALQGQGSKFGARQCVGHVDFGIVTFSVAESGAYSWKPDIVVVNSQKAKILRF